MDVDVLTKCFKKMALTRDRYDEERAGSPMDVDDVDRDEILHQNFDCLRKAEGSGDDDDGNEH